MADIDGYPLFETYPSRRERVQRIALATFPTAVQRLPSLERRLGLGSLWIKRDDTSGRLCGGNKVRKLEYLLADGSGSPERKIIVYGPVSSNWTLACTIYAHHLGIPVHLFLFRMKGVMEREEVLSIQRERSENLEILPSPACLPLKLLRPSMIRDMLRGRARMMPPGGTSPTSILGYVNAFFELVGQVESGLLPMPAVILLPYGTGGTAAGLAAGAVLSGKRCRILGVRVASRAFSNLWVGRALAGAALRIIGAGPESTGPVQLTGNVLEVENAFTGGGYGQSTPEGREASEMVRGEEGIILDSTYTAKAMSCLIDRANRGWGRDKHVLFWHTLNSLDIDSCL